MKYRLFLSLILVTIVAVLAAVPVAAQDAEPTPFVAEVGPITQRVIDRGVLICGVNALLPGFGTTNDAGEFTGFDVDMCRAVAAAILGDADAVEFRALTAAERPTALASGEIDMLSRNTTWTLSRDTEWGATFAPTTLYDCHGVSVRDAAGCVTIVDLAGAP